MSLIFLILLIVLLIYGIILRYIYGNYAIVTILVTLILLTLSLKTCIFNTEEKVLKAMIKDNKIEYLANPPTGRLVIVLKDRSCVNLYNLIKIDKD